MIEVKNLHKYFGKLQVLKGITETIEDGEVVKAAVSVNFGTFISTIINFIILAFAIFLMVKAINSARAKAEKKEEEKPAEPPAPPEPSAEEKLLTEIRDLLKKE